MADTQVTSFTALTGGNLAVGDLFPVIDISAAGALKNSIITSAELIVGLKALGSFAALTANTFTAAQLIDGSADAIQLRVQGHSTQTAKAITVENSSGTVEFSVAIDGSGTTTVGTTATGWTLASYGAALRTGGNNKLTCDLFGGVRIFALASDMTFSWNNSTNLDSGTKDLILSRTSTGALDLMGNATGAPMQMTEMTAPAAPSANKGILYLEDNGAGKTRLMIVFGSGAAQQIAIEP